MKRNLILIITVLALISCEINNEMKESYFFIFYPRKANHVWVTPCKIITTEYKGDLYYEYLKINSDERLKINDFFLSVITADKRIDSLIKESINPLYEYITFSFGSKFTSQGIPALEKEITLNYNKYIKSRSAKNNNNNGFGDSSENIEYREDGIEKFNITALDAPLFGKPIGTSLNQYFEIFNYSPNFISSYENKSLLYGYTDKVKPTTIDEWLSLAPLAQPTMFLRLNTIPENLPLTLRFKVDMVTTDGIMITDTTKIFTLTN